MAELLYNILVDTGQPQSLVGSCEESFFNTGLGSLWTIPSGSLPSPCSFRLTQSAGTQGLLTWASHLIEIRLKHNDSKIVFVSRASLEIPEQGESQGYNILATPLTISMGNPFRLKVLGFSWPGWGLLKIKLEYTKIWLESNSSIRQMKTRGSAEYTKQPTGKASTIGVRKHYGRECLTR